uniref:HMA domain-containing protein n=1 Tax=Aegilops tauschii subsp. strangulata TaxID=200361 RepID=A0A453PW12_AEGTS
NDLQKIVIRADLIGEKCKSKIMSIVAKLEGIKSMDIDQDKCTLTVVGTRRPGARRAEAQEFVLRRDRRQHGRQQAQGEEEPLLGGLREGLEGEVREGLQREVREGLQGAVLRRPREGDTVVPLHAGLLLQPLRPAQLPLLQQWLRLRRAHTAAATGIRLL